MTKSKRAKEQESKRGVLSILFFLVSLASLHGGEPFEKSLVKVYLHREFLGLLHNNRLLSQTQIREVAEFKGAALAPGGYVVSYVGSYGPEFAAPEADLWIEARGGRRYPARLVGVDERIALAVLNSELPLPPLALATFSPDLKPLFVSSTAHGWEIYSPPLFNVTGKEDLPEKEVQVAGLGRSIPPREWEGGFALDQKGRMLGVITRIGPHAMGRRIQVCRVLPAEVIRDSVRRIVREGKNIRAGWLGVVLLEPHSMPGTGRRTATGGIGIRSVVSGSPAEKAGLRPGDRIVQVGDRAVQNAQDLIQQIKWRSAGEKLALSVDRRGQVQEVTALLTERQDVRPMVSWALELPQVWDESSPLQEKLRMYRTLLPPILRMGFELEPLTPQLAEYFRAPGGSGLLVKSILAGSTAEQAGFLAGDVLIQVNGEDVSSISGIQERLKASPEGGIVIRFLRDRQVRTQTIVLR